MLPRTLSLVGALGLSACGGIAVIDAGAGAAGGAGGDVGGAGGSGASAGGGGLGGSGGSPGGAGGSPGGAGGIGGIGGAPANIYVNDGSTLFRLDPATQEVVPVGPLVGCASLNELAVDQAGAMFGTSDGALYAIDPVTASCELLATGTYPRALSFVPAGTIDPDEQALVGYLDAAYVRIDTVTGAVTPLGMLGGGFIASGDVVSTIGGKTYLTVTQAGCNDCLVEVDPTSGDVIAMLGPLEHSKVWGLAYWGGAAFGFTKAGEAFRIDFVNQPDGTQGLVFTELATAGDYSFWGAGSSTSAPL